MSAQPHQPERAESTVSSSSPSDPDSLWARVLESASSNKRLASIIDEFRLDSLAGPAAVLIGRATLVPMAQANAAAIEDLLSRASGRPIRVEIRPDLAAVAAAAATSAAAPPPVNLNDHPLVKQAVDLFGVKTPIRVVPRKKNDTPA